MEMMAESVLDDALELTEPAELTRPQPIDENQLTAHLIVVGVVGLDRPPAILDIETRWNDPESPGEGLASRDEARVIVCEAISIAMTVFPNPGNYRFASDPGGTDSQNRGSVHPGRIPAPSSPYPMRLGTEIRIVIFSERFRPAKFI
jgi:hypothetical protein